MKRTLITLAAAVVACTSRAYDLPSNDLASASYGDVKAAADQDAIAWYAAHRTTKADESALIAIGKGHALKRGAVGSMSDTYAITFEIGVEGQIAAAKAD